MLQIKIYRPGEPEDNPVDVIEATPGAFLPPGLALPAGGSATLLRGNLCDAASLTFSRPPASRPLDWVRVWVPGRESCAYLGYVTTEALQLDPGKFTLSVASLKDLVKKCYWWGDVATDAKTGAQTIMPIVAPFRDFLLNILGRTPLPKGITIGDIPESPALLRSQMRAQLLGDTLDASIGALPGGSWGVDAQGRLCICAIPEQVTDRFPLGHADLPPGSLSDYANAVEFPYTQPSGATVYYRFQDTEAIQDAQAVIYTVDSLPTNVSTKRINPYAPETQSLALTLTHPDAPNYGDSQSGSGTVTDPAWGGHMGDVVSTDRTVLSGTQATIQGYGDEAVKVIGTGNTLQSNDYRLEVRLPVGMTKVNLTVQRLEPDKSGGTTRTVTGGDWAGVDNIPYGSVSQPGYTWSDNVTLSYDASEYQAYIQARGKKPPGFDVRLVYLNGLPGDLMGESVGYAANNPLVPIKIRSVWSLNPNVPQGTYLSAARGVRPLDPPTQLRVSLGIVRQWRKGDTVTTDPGVSAVSVTDITATPAQTLILTRVSDDEQGRRVWALPQDARLSDVVLGGDPGQIGWIGVNLTDEAALAAYGYELLRYRKQVTRSWTGLYPTLTWADGRGQYVFETPDGGDEALDVQRVTLDFDRWQTRVECGTPLPLDHDQAILAQFSKVAQDIRAFGGG